ncbi:MAG: Gfo/Idh/MocA family oxidoreductase [Pirellulales bacterium]
MNALRIAVIGGGHLGRIHARLLADAPGVQLVAVADPIAKSRDEAAAGARTEAVADYRELFGRIDAAVVATPTATHRDVALDLIERGVHVLVEKPIASTSAEAEVLVAAARRRSVVLQVGHVERFNPAWKLLAGEIGRPRFIDALRCGPYTFRSTDVSVVLDLMVHDVDLVLSLVDSPVERIDALGHAVIGPHDDLANARIQFADGTVANLSASRVSYEAERRMRIFSTAGFASVDFAARTSTLVNASPRLSEPGFDAALLPPEAKNLFKERLFADVLPIRRLPAVDGNAIAEELLDFAECIRAGRAPQVTGEQGLAALAVCEAIGEQIARHNGREAAAKTLAHPAMLPAADRRAAG